MTNAEAGMLHCTLAKDDRVWGVAVLLHICNDRDSCTVMLLGPKFMWHSTRQTPLKRTWQSMFTHRHRQLIFQCVQPIK